MDKTKAQSPKSLVLSNFKYGLDTRRSELSSVPGTLLVAENGHINAGGQFEKRKAFPNLGSLTLVTFGLQETEAGLVVFGSVPLTLHTKWRSRATNVAILDINSVVPLTNFLSIGMSVTIAGVTNAVGGNYNGVKVLTQVTATSILYANAGTNEGTIADTGGTATWAGPTLPANVVYQPLTPPNGYNETVDICLTEIIYSCNYKGKAFCLAKFTNDASVFAFYDGTLVQESRNGRVLFTEFGDETVTQLATDLATNVADIEGWLATANKNATAQTDQTGTTVAGSVLIRSPGAVHFIPTPDFDSTNGLFGAKLVDQNYPGTANVSAKASFTLTGGTVIADTVQVSAPKNADGTGTANLTQGYIPFNTSLIQTAIDVVTAINTNTFLTGYTAAVVTGTASITVAAPNSFGGVTFNLTVDVTGAMSSTAYAGPPAVVPMAVVMQYSTVVATLLSGTIIYASDKCIVTDAPATPTYTWSLVDNPTGSMVVCDTPLDVPRTSPFIYFHQSDPYPTSGGIVGDTNNRHHAVITTPSTFLTKWKCTVKSGALPDAVIEFQVKFVRY